jgi:hypothetical protein
VIADKHNHEVNSKIPTSTECRVGYDHQANEHKSLLEMKKHYTSVGNDNHGHDYTSHLSTWSTLCPSLHSKHLMTVPLIHPATGEFTNHSSSGPDAGEGDRTEEGRSPTCGVTGATVFGVQCRFEPAHNTVL